ncbi:hormonally up-regulated neu tumor-associated kinase, partial [Trichonephila clavata]
MSNCINATPFFVGKYYEVSDIVLGRGSFSTVYLARHKVFGTKVALKVIDRKNIKEEYVLKNLHREAKILRKLNHPNIVNFYEEFLHNDLYCIAMEHISGPDLSFHLKKQVYHRLSEHSAKILFYQMVMAVQHMHESNILH